MLYNKKSNVECYKNCKTIPDLLLALEKQEEACFQFYDFKGEITKKSYQDIVGNAKKIAATLKAKGIGYQDKVSIVLPTSQNFLEVFFGIQLLGATPCALYPPLRLGKLDEWKEKTGLMIKNIDSKVVITDKRIYNLLGEPVRFANPPLGCLLTENLINEDSFCADSFSESDLCFIQYSSGSTGTPKPVMISNSNVIANCEAILSTFHLDKSQYSCVSWLPLYHDMGLVGTLMSSMVAQCTITLIPPEVFITRPFSWLDALTKTKATVSVAPNFAFGLCLKKIKEKDLEKLDLSNWKIAMCGAEPVHPKTMMNFNDRFEKYGFNKNALAPVYGQAEATLAVTFSEINTGIKYKSFDNDELINNSRAVLKDNGLKIISLGRPIDKTELKICGKQGNTLEEMELGKLYIKSPSVMQGYYKDPEKTKESLENDWLDSGDQGFILDNELYLFGRTRDILIIKGRNYDPSIIERSVDEFTEVRKGCYVAVSVLCEDTDSEELVIIAEMADLANKSKDELDLIKEAITKKVVEQNQLRPMDVIFVYPSNIPRTSSGKLSRSRSKDLYLEGTILQKIKPIRIKIMKEMLFGKINHIRRKLKI